MEDQIRNLLRGLLYIAAPVALNLLAQTISNRRDEELFKVKVQEEVNRQLKLMLPSGQND